MSPEQDKAKPPFADLNVVDLSRVLAGPYCAQLLADMGASVIKVESPEGDENRRWGVRDEEGMTCNFASVNRGKRSVTLDLKSSAAKEPLRRLFAQADVVLQSFRPDTATRLGVDYEAVRAINPRVIHCSISGYGERGPLRNQPGYDLMMQAFSGVMSMTGIEGWPPVRVGPSFIDMSTGLVAYGGIVTALLVRHFGKGGASVTASLLETAISLLGYHAVNWLQDGRLPRKEGSGVWHLVPYQAFKCVDGYILAGATNDVAWRNFCKALCCEDLARDERFCTTDKRLAARSTLVPLLEAQFATRPVSHWIERFGHHNVAVAPVNDLEQIMSHPQVAANNMIVEARTAGGRMTKVIGTPFKLSYHRQTAPDAAPALGADTDFVLRKLLGLDDGAIDRLRSETAFS